jgi:hypothetical protein
VQHNPSGIDDLAKQRLLARVQSVQDALDDPPRLQLVIGKRIGSDRIPEPIQFAPNRLDDPFASKPTNRRIVEQFMHRRQTSE